MSAAHKKSLFLESLRLLDNQTFINPLGFLKKLWKCPEMQKSILFMSLAIKSHGKLSNCCISYKSKKSNILESLMGRFLLQIVKFLPNFHQ